MKYQLILNGNEYANEEARITGRDILALGDLTPPDNFELLKKIIDKEYEPIQLDEVVDLSVPGIEHFLANEIEKLKYFLDDEEYFTMDTMLTPVQILQKHDLDPNHFYLKLLKKHKEITYKNDTEAKIDMIEEPKFITCKNEPTTVSCENINIGLPELQRQLDELGYKTYILNQFVCFHYTIPIGRFRGKNVEIALEAPQFPLNPPSGPSFKPFLLPITNGGGEHPFGGIHERNQPTPEWQYWSRPFSNWNTSGKNAKTYLAFLRTLLDFE